VQKCSGWFTWQTCGRNPKGTSATTDPKNAISSQSLPQICDVSNWQQIGYPFDNPDHSASKEGSLSWYRLCRRVAALGSHSLTAAPYAIQAAERKALAEGLKLLVMSSMHRLLRCSSQDPAGREI
jgi:hypothetical protein